MKAISLVNKAQDTEAIRLFLEVLSKDPNNASANLNIGIAYAQDRQKAYEKALPYLLKARELVPKNELAARWLGFTLKSLERFAEAESHLSQALTLGSKRDPTMIEVLGVVKLKLDKFDEAKALLSEALASKPDADWIHHQLGLIAGKQKQWHEAVQHLEKALIKNPNWFDSHWVAGQCYFELKDYAQAEKHVAKVIEYDNKHVDALFMMANIALNQGRYTKALDYIERIPSTPETSKTLMQLRFDLALLRSVEDPSSPELENRYEDYIRVSYRGPQAEAGLSCYHSDSSRLQGLKVRESILPLLARRIKEIRTEDYEIQDGLASTLSPKSRYFFAMKERSPLPLYLSALDFDTRRKILLDAFSETKDQLKLQGLTCNFMNASDEKIEEFQTTLSEISSRTLKP